MKLRTFLVSIAVVAVTAVLFGGCAQQSYYNPDTRQSSVTTRAQQKYVAFEHGSLTLEVGEVANVNAYVLPQSEEALSYKTSDQAVATVDTDGVVFARAKGKAVITAATSDGKASGTCTVTVGDFRRLILTGTVPPSAPAGSTFTIQISFENCTHLSVQIVSDTAGGSVRGAAINQNFGAASVQLRFTGTATLRFSTSSKAADTVRILAYDGGQLFDVREYTVTRPASSQAG